MAAAAESPAPILYAEPNKSYPTPPQMAHSPATPVGAAGGGYYQPQAQGPPRWSQTPSELSSETSASPPPASYGYAHPNQQPQTWQGQPQQGYTPVATYGSQGYQSGRSEWGSMANPTSGLQPISELGNTQASAPSGQAGRYYN